MAQSLDPEFKRCLAFAGYALPRQPEPQIPTGCSLVPLDARPFVLRRTLSLPVADVRKFTDRNDHDRINEEIADRFTELTSKYPSIEMHHFQNHFWRLAVPLAYWQILIRRVLEEYKPSLLYLPESFQHPPLTVSSKEELHRWCISRLFRQLSEEYAFEMFEEETLQTGRSRLTRALSSGDSVWEILYRANRLRRSKVSGLLARLHRNSQATDVKPQTVVISIAQPKKSTRLGDVLRGLSWTPISVSEITGRSDAPHIETQGPIALNAQSDVWQAVEAFLVHCAKEQQEDHNAIDTFVHQPWKVLLTDHQYHPVVREIIDGALAAGKRIAYLPEAAQEEASDVKKGISNFWYYPKPEIVEFCVGSAQLTGAGTRPVRDTIPSGYFGDTFQVDVFANWVAKRIGNSSHRKGRTPVFFDLHIGSRPGLSWPGRPTEFDEIGYNLDILDAIDFTQFYVIAKHRYAPLVSAYRRLYPSDDVVFVENIPWQSLAGISQVVILRDSSIGIESLALRIPVVLYRPPDTAPIADTWGALQSDVLETISRPEDVNSAISRLLTSSRTDFDKYSPFFASNQSLLHSWVELNSA